MHPPRCLQIILVLCLLTLGACGGDSGRDDLGVVIDGQNEIDTAQVESTSTVEAETDEPIESDATTSSTTIAPGPSLVLGRPLGPTTAALVPDVGEPLDVLPGEPPYRGVLANIDLDFAFLDPLVSPPSVAPGTAPLTGLKTSEDLSSRPALLAKIDNTSKGRPQASLNQADLVYEEEVEGGVTRLAVVFHSQAPPIGPVRSGRTTDVALLGSLNRPAFVWSGANLVFAELLRRQPMIDVGAQASRNYRRAGDRPAPYNLMTDASSMFSRIGDGDPPPAHFAYRPPGGALPAGSVPVADLTVTHARSTARWDWDGEVWLRTHNGTDHVDASGERVAAANVVVLEMPQIATGSVDVGGSPVYEDVFLGEGTAFVFTDGHGVPAVWTRPSLRSVATLTTIDGAVIELTPGITWVQLARPGTTVAN